MSKPIMPKKKALAEAIARGRKDAIQAPDDGGSFDYSELTRDLVRIDNIFKSKAQYFTRAPGTYAGWLPAKKKKKFHFF